MAAGYTPRAGDLLVHEDGSRQLVGDINELGGSCDCCRDSPWRCESVDEGGLVCVLDPGWRLDRNVLA